MIQYKDRVSHRCKAAIMHFKNENVCSDPCDSLTYIGLPDSRTEHFKENI